MAFVRLFFIVVVLFLVGSCRPLFTEVLVNKHFRRVDGLLHVLYQARHPNTHLV